MDESTTSASYWHVFIHSVGFGDRSCSTALAGTWSVVPTQQLWTYLSTCYRGIFLPQPLASWLRNSGVDPAVCVLTVCPGDSEFEDQWRRRSFSTHLSSNTQPSFAWRRESSFFLLLLCTNSSCSSHKKHLLHHYQVDPCHCFQVLLGTRLLYIFSLNHHAISWETF